MANGNEAAPIIKKVKKVAGHGHHGGAWKVAYADFVTAMMAFFLLMWLLSSTSEDQRKGIADYFSQNVPISEQSSGGAGIFGGDVVFTSETSLSQGSGGATDGDDESEREDDEANPGAPPEGLETADMQESKGLAEKAAELTDKVIEALAEETIGEFPGAEGGAGEGEDQAGKTPDVENFDDETLKAAEAEKRERDMQAVEAAFEALKEANEGDTLLQHLSMKLTPEGLMIEIAEVDGRPLFAKGSADATETLTALIAIVAPIIAQLENDVAIIGHTDATPYRPGSKQTNWTLSADRADAARRILLDLGLVEQRIARITGAAATQPLSEDAFAPENRRIGIILLREPISAPAQSEASQTPE